MTEIMAEGEQRGHRRSRTRRFLSISRQPQDFPMMPLPPYRQNAKRMYGDPGAKWAIAFHVKLIVSFAHSTQDSYALIVDSELSKLPAFNARQIPLCGRFVLPVNWHLSYATADSGKEYLANRALATSDTISTQLLDFLSREVRDAEGWAPVEDVENYSPAHLFLERIAGTSKWRLHYEPSEEETI